MKAEIIEIRENSITSFVFYRSILPELHRTIKYAKSITISFPNATYVSPLILPNLLICGIAVFRHLNSPLKLAFPYHPKLFGDLESMEWPRLAEKSKAIIFEPEIGGASAERPLNEKCCFFSVEPNMDLTTIKLPDGTELKDPCINKEQVDNIVSIFHSHKHEDISSKLIHVINEALKNSITHGLMSKKKRVVETTETTYACYYGRRDKSFYFSVSDFGGGFYDSLANKLGSEDAKTGEPISLKLFSEEEFTKNDKDKHFRAILEAIFFRKQTDMCSVYSRTPIYGIYSIFADVFAFKGGVVRIHSHDTQVIFTKNNFSPFSKENPSKEEIACLKQDFIFKTNRSDPAHAPLRIEDEWLHGVHIEIEIPLSSGSN